MPRKDPARTPQQRPTLSAVLQNPLFRLQGVGDQAARAIIKQVITEEAQAEKRCAEEPAKPQ